MTQLPTMQQLLGIGMKACHGYLNPKYLQLALDAVISVVLEAEREALRQAVADRDAALSKLAKARKQLLECEEFFEERADAEYFPDSPSPVPNPEMRMLVDVRATLTEIGGE